MLLIKTPFFSSRKFDLFRAYVTTEPQQENAPHVAEQGAKNGASDMLLFAGGSIWAMEWAPLRTSIENKGKLHAHTHTHTQTRFGK